MRVVHYLNQFFGGIGGEDKAGTGVTVKAGPAGPGLALTRAGCEVVATVICGDNYMAEHMEKAGAEIVAAIAEYKPDAVIAGPAFGAGRYGVACGLVCQMAQDKLGIPAVAGMSPENAGVEIYRRQVYIITTGERPSEMEPALKKMAGLAGKLVGGDAVGPADDEGYIARGRRANGYADEPAGERAVAMLVARLQGKPWRTELELPPFDQVEPAAPISPKNARVALVTTGGVVPLGNPDRMAVGRPSTYYTYDITNLNDFDPAVYEVHHAGFETKYSSADPDRILPLDVARMMEREGLIKELHPEYFVTAGQGGMVQACTNIGQRLAQDLVAKGVTAVVLTAT